MKNIYKKQVKPLFGLKKFVLNLNGQVIDKDINNILMTNECLIFVDKKGNVYGSGYKYTLGLEAYYYDHSDDMYIDNFILLDLGFVPESIVEENDKMTILKDTIGKTYAVTPKWTGYRRLGDPVDQIADENPKQI